MARLGDVFELQITGEWGNECSENETGTKVLRTTNFTSEGIINYNDVVVRSISEAKIEKKKLHYGDIILEKSGGTEKTPVGRVVFCDEFIENDTYLCNNFTQAMRVNKAIAVPKYVFYFMWNLHYSGKTDLLQNKTTGIRNLQVKAYLNEDFYLPSLEEQRKIAAVLDKVSDLITKRRQQLEKLDLLEKARFVEMFGDPVINPKGWEKFTLGKRCDIVTGNTPSRAEPENFGNFIEWIKSDNINTPSMFLTEAQEYLSEIGFKKCRFVETDSLLMTCIAGSINCIGNVAVTGHRVAFNQQINAIVPKRDNVLYLYWLMLLSKPKIHGTINMALKGILSKGQLSEMVFPFPPIELQGQFATFVEQTEKIKTSIRESLTKLQTLKKALMQEYFG